MNRLPCLGEIGLRGGSSGGVALGHTLGIGVTQLDGDMQQEEGATCDALELEDRHGHP